MENALDRFEKLLKQHCYEALSHEEKEWVKQFVASAAEYDSLRRANEALDSHFSQASPIVPDPGVLASLQKQFQVKVEMKKRWAVPAWAAVLAIFVATGSGWYVGTNVAPREVYVDRVVSKTDTIRVASRPDTVVIDRVVYRQVNALVPVSVSQPIPLRVPAAKGVNMKEKEELEKLLVSGGL